MMPLPAHVRADTVPSGHNADTCPRREFPGIDGPQSGRPVTQSESTQVRRARNRRLLFAVALACGLTGCGAFKGTGPTGVDGLFPAQGPLIGDTTLNVSKSTHIPMEKIVAWGLYAGAAWLILDPLAPNWEIEQASFPDRYYHLSLKMKRVYAGGAGEARVVFHQRARELMRQNGFDGYSVVEYTEGLNSSVLGSQRVAQGVILLTRK